jgi:8-oxo-dGTP pyrophosphatase MutT (NUDIX family)
VDAIPDQSGKRGVVAVIPRDGQVLVIRRSPFVVAPGAYCFPGGGVEEGETPPEALKRELREELGVGVLPQRCLWESITPWQVELQWWLARLVAGAKPQANPAEVDAFAWVTLDRMAELPQLLASNRAFLQAIDRGEIAWPP